MENQPHQAKNTSLVPSVNPNSPTPPVTGELNTLLTYGGIAVAVILAITIYSRVQFDGLVQMIETIKKKK